MTTICSQCGAVLPANSTYCHFCDTSFATDIPESDPRVSSSETRGNLALDSQPNAAWRAELVHRLASYRARRHRTPGIDAQTQIQFQHSEVGDPSGTAVDLTDPRAAFERDDEDFAFTIAIGRMAKSRNAVAAGPVEIDVSLPLPFDPAENNDGLPQPAAFHPRLFSVAPLGDRRVAALLDLLCLLFAYGGFLALFGSLGGQFTLGKLSAAVYAATIALFYLQYFALFTVFGGATPGMMLRNLHVVGFSGEPPTPRQLLLRSVGYVLSAGSFFLGFLWAQWDEDELTWHDRFSRTYLTSAAPPAHEGVCNSLPHV